MTALRIGELMLAEREQQDQGEDEDIDRDDECMRQLTEGDPRLIGDSDKEGEHCSRSYLISCLSIFVPSQTTLNA